jgi:hypothetical protein
LSDKGLRPIDPNPNPMAWFWVKRWYTPSGLWPKYRDSPFWRWFFYRRMPD